MNSMIKNISIIERIDQLIRLQATGSPRAFAYRLGISKTKLYRVIETMKTLRAPIVFDIAQQSYVYTEQVDFSFGFTRMNQPDASGKSKTVKC